MRIRMAERRDLQELLDIYNYEVENGVATFELIPRNMKEWEEWFAAHSVDNHPLIVAEREGHVAGYASLSAYHPRGAFYCTVELSVYVSPSDRRCGVATALMEAILQMAREDDSIHTVVSLITSENEVSCALHEKFGFELCGKIPEIGRKFGRYLGLNYYRLGV